MISPNPKLEIFKASAGSGKTHQLALRYISFLLGRRINEQGDIQLYTKSERKLHREILAITFTNKATEEMKERIVYELYCLSDVSRKSKLRDDLLKMTRVSSEQLAEAANDALTSLLYDFGEMQISTIDAFFQKILRSFAYEADLGGNYELMVDNQQMIEMAIADTLAMITSTKSISPKEKKRVTMIRGWVKELLLSNATKSTEIKIFDPDSGIRSNILRFITRLSDESYQAKSKALSSFLQQQDSIDNLLKNLNSKSDELQVVIQDIVKDIYNISSDTISVNARKMFDRIFEGKLDDLTDSNLLFVSGENNDYAKFFKKGTFNTSLDELIELLFNKVRIAFTIKELTSQMYLLGLFREVLDIASRMKVHLNTILLSDTNSLLNEIIADSDTPFVYERTGQKLRHFLIDEFQDTSLLQWKNLHPLIVNSIGSGNDNMIIGDVKQCIYRFRNSYPDLLDSELENDSDFRHAVDLPILDTNRRSSKDIVEFNNELFSSIAAKYSDIKSYNHVSQVPFNTESGYVDISVCKNFSNTVFERMIQHIRRQLDSGYTPNKIAVLVRRKSHAKHVVDKLLEASCSGGILEGISIVSDEALYVSSSKAVDYIVSQLRVLDRIQKDVNNIPVSHKTGLPKTTDFELDWIREQLFQLNSRGISGNSAIEEILHEFDERNHLAAKSQADDEKWRVRTRGRSVFEVVEELILTLPDENWALQEAQYISAFQDLVIEYCRSGSPSIHGFLKRWDEHLRDNAAIGLPSNSMAIRVMTIHKSKGLEFDCVHVPLYAEQPNQKSNFRWYGAKEIFKQLSLNCLTPEYFPLNSNSDLKSTLFSDEYNKVCREQFVDELNVLYVAFTRAKYELVVTADSSKGSVGALIYDALRHSMIESDDGAYNYTKADQTVCNNITPNNVDDKCMNIGLEKYHVYDRLDIWHSSKPSSETDLGELL